MNWEDYKTQVKQNDPIGKEIIEEAEEEASVITAMIKQRAKLGLSQRDLAELCAMPQSSIARIESNKTSPRLDTLIKLLSQLGLRISISPAITSK